MKASLEFPFLTKQRLFVNALVVTTMYFFLKHDTENFVLLT